MVPGSVTINKLMNLNKNIDSLIIEWEGESYLSIVPCHLSLVSTTIICDQ